MSSTLYICSTGDKPGNLFSIRSLHAWAHQTELPAARTRTWRPSTRVSGRDTKSAWGTPHRRPRLVGASRTPRRASTTTARTRTWRPSTRVSGRETKSAWGTPRRRRASTTTARTRTWRPSTTTYFLIISKLAWRLSFGRHSDIWTSFEIRLSHLLMVNAHEVHLQQNVRVLAAWCPPACFKGASSRLSGSERSLALAAFPIFSQMWRLHRKRRWPAGKWLVGMSLQHARQNRSPLASTLPSLTVEYLAALAVSVQCVGVVCPKHFLSLFLTLEYLATMSVSVQWLSMPRVRAAVRGSKRGLLASHQCCIYSVLDIYAIKLGS